MRTVVLVCLTLAAAAIGSCGGSAFETGDASGGSAGSSGSATGGAGGKGGSGGSAASGGSSGTSGVGGSGSGGTGGMVVVDRSCATDSDCVLGYRALLCCGDCPRAMARKFVDAQPCYCVQNESCDAPVTCKEDPCSLGCPAVACLEPMGVKCDQGVCTEVYNGTGGTGGTGGSGGACADLIAEYDALVVAARACSTDAQVQQCTGQTTVPDRCGCPIVLNDTSPASAEAINMYQQWVDFGCGPFMCGAACVAATSAHCELEGPGSGYVCMWGP